jgi:hypothetical protein
MTGTRFEHDNYYKYDLREPPRKIVHPDRIKTHRVENLTDNWTDIPFYPSAEKKHELVSQYGVNQAEQIIQYSYENSTDPTMHVVPPHLQNPRQTHFISKQHTPYQKRQHQKQEEQIEEQTVQKLEEDIEEEQSPIQSYYQQPQNQLQSYYQHQNQHQNYYQPTNQNYNALYLMQIQKYNEALRQMNSETRIIPPNINKFSPAYSRIIAAKPRASKSVNIGLGGVY